MTQTTKHTPGPWKWWTSCSWRRLSQDLPRAKDGGVLCPYVCRDGHPDVQVSDADARLIASAPDLLEAAEQALNFIENTESELGITLESGIMLRAAIKRALEG
jgi:hypothetical protein